MATPSPSSLVTAPQGATASTALKQIAGEFVFVIILVAIAGVGNAGTFVAVFLGILWILWLMNRYG